jgi:hypothetical protein
MPMGGDHPHRRSSPQEDAVALQGDLKSFALPDVLRLLAGTGKSGVLEVSSALAVGEVVLREGTIATAATTAAPRSNEPADVVFELLRFEDGTFGFEEGPVDEVGLAADVEDTIRAAEAMVEQWAEIEAVVPSMEAWVSLAADLELDEVVVSAADWRAVAAVGGGGNVSDLAAALELSDMAACRQVMALVDSGLVHVRATHGYQPPQVALDDLGGLDELDGLDEPLIDPISDLHDLTAEDRPVVMEDSDDALLPEPLPGEGVAYEGETITGSVDGRAFEASAGSGSPIDGSNEAFEQFESLASFEAAAAMSDRIGEPGTIEGFGDADPFAPVDPHGFASGTSADEPGAPDGSAAVREMPTAATAGPVDEERDSLLKFLSSVKP